jgi:nucleotide-binding universal stress UspA family protein
LLSANRKEDDMSPTTPQAPTRMTVVVGVDLTDVSAHLLAQTATLVRTIDEPEIHVVHVVKPEQLLLRLVRPADEKDAGVVYRVEHAQEAVGSLCASLERTPRTRVFVHTPVGDAATELSRIAAEVAADVIVVEAHDHHVHRRVLRRSVVDHIAGLARSTVVTLHKPAGDYGARPTGAIQAITPS